ncbi:MAG: bacillithiol system redox-active protein YtxJ [Gemmatimonadota bacterium]|nr:bacillithiol system redox-active protein YtxJ [Gemmatimonadota bacterium]MDH3369499.1 bacillithiol system redox-active protein YtxJ [Gemmatimonadota bacterium]MDH3478047.1 bacillithiol system redox-active protein YtxJ [Gemmatimonadota bacterium]MDH5551438.1 bacillithiol system redox-active protein YtxJ [Gemmatimonadota bacterium]
MTDDALRRVTQEADLEGVLDEALAVVYKHSPRCGVSAAALIEVRQFAAGHPEVPVYRVNVIAHRPVSQVIAERLEVRHQSPQVILVRHGQTVWHASHYRVSAERLEAALADARAGHET